MNIGVHKQEQNIIGQKQPGISRRPLYTILWLASRVWLQEEHQWLNVEMYKLQLIQHYVIQFVSGLWQVVGFLQVFRFPPPIKLTATI